MAGLEMKYFVLKPKGDDAYAAASRTAILAYADAIKDENRDLFLDLTKWIVNINDSFFNQRRE